MLEEFILLSTTLFELLSYQQFPLIILLLRLLPIRQQRLSLLVLLLLVHLNLLLLGHVNPHLLLLDLLLRLNPRFHLLLLRHHFFLFLLYLLHILYIIFILQHLDFPGLLACLFDLLPGSRHLILEHSHSVPEQLAVLLDLLPDGPSLWVREVLGLQIDHAT